jgi:hypothetical protein
MEKHKAINQVWYLPHPNISKFDNALLGAGVAVWRSDIYPVLKTMVINVTCSYRYEIFH